MACAGCMWVHVGGWAHDVGDPSMTRNPMTVGGGPPGDSGDGGGYADGADGCGPSYADVLLSFLVPWPGPSALAQDASYSLSVP